MKRSLKISALALMLPPLLQQAWAATAATAGVDNIKKAAYGFCHPQDTARTKTWWFHGETETTRRGITADLEAFKRVGVGGVVYYDQVHLKNPERAFPGFSPEWWQMLRFAAEEAERVGLSFEVNISNGFVAGGSWITPDMAMQRLAATDTVVEGGRWFEGVIKKPASKYNYSAHVATLAMPLPEGGGRTTANVPVKVSAKGCPQPERIFKDTDKLVSIKRHAAGGAVEIVMDFGREFTARSLTYRTRPRGKATTSATNVPGEPSDTFVGTGYRVLPMLGQLEVSADGHRYRPVADILPIYQAHGSWRYKTVAFAAATGRYFRLRLHDWWEPGEKNTDLMICSVELSSDARMDRWEEKAALVSEYIGRDATPQYSAAEVTGSRRIVRIDQYMDSRGVLRWRVPEGRWRIMRFAHVPTGGRSKHGRPNLLGLECDKLSRRAAIAQWNGYVGRIIDSLRATGSGRLEGVVMDSHEAGSQNWTADFPAEFQRRRGYSPIKLLPAMAGYVVDSAPATAAFLQDVRRTIADMIADNYYGTIDSLCRAGGLILTAQATGNALCIPADPIQAKSRVQKPQGEFWPIHPDGNYDIKECSSAARLYGKPIASAEAFTDAKYSHSPAELKALADYAYAFGINEFVVCASAYQPWTDRIPGNTGGGRHYCLNRNNTWWEYSRGFWDYQARMAYMMRRGRAVADICVYLGENAPVKILTCRLPRIPGGYDFDAFTTDALLNRMTVKDGRIALPDGTSYGMMALPGNGDITLRALWKIAGMVRQGAKVYGPKPVYGGDGAKDERAQFRSLVDELWGTDGKGGKVICNMPIGKAVEKAGLAPDVRMARGDTRGNKIYFTHRRVDDADIYFLHNHKHSAERNTFFLRSAYSKAQLWDPVTGKRHLLDIRPDGGVELTMAPMQSFVIIMTDSAGAGGSEPQRHYTWAGSGRRSEIGGAWTVTFDSRMGGPKESVIWNSLNDWTTSANDSIRHFSGTAIYRNSFHFKPQPDAQAVRRPVFVEFENPVYAAEVIINGQSAGTVWCAPYRCDISHLIRQGSNSIEIRVCNSLMNRMVADRRLPQSERITYCYPDIVTPADTLVSSGIRGRVFVATGR